MGDLRFDDRVAVVTGAGAGLGRAYALLFASRGAKVVVNDLGGGRHGDGSSSKAADAVVEEIRQNGGTAVADYNSVVEGEKIIKTALDNFGRVDILINNAGILRDKSFARISDQDWDLVHAVHLKGSFKTTQAAFPIFKKQNYGRIIMTASNSGLYGNFGQANYSAAKMGLVGLSNTVAIEGSRNNIHCNVIVPTAASRLTEDIIPPELFAELKPELIAPVVAYLCHETCSENGTIIEAAAGWAGKCHLIRSNGSILRSKITDGVSVENVAKNWEKVTDMSKAEHLNTIQEATLALVSSLDSLRSSKGGDVSEGNPVSFSSKDTILYALGVGASTENPNELKYLYENHEDFTALPTFYILPAMQAIFTSDATQNIIPGRTISLDQVLHGEHYIEFVGDVPTEGRLISKSSVAEVLDKGSGAAIVHNVESFNEDGELVVKNQCVVFAVGAGNFGGPRNGTQIVPCVPVPKRKPDITLTQRTSVDQAALYRLSGDLNPLHIDPNFSIVAGYETPILHGLCTLGFSVRLVLKGYANYDAKLVNSIKARFVKPVIPGQTLKVDMWQDGNRIHFETSVVETGKIVISGAFVQLKSVSKMQIVPNKLAALELESDAIFEYIADQLKQDPSKGKSVNGIFLYKITKNGKQAKQWTMDLKAGVVYEGEPKEKPNTTLTISDEDFMLLATNKLNPQVAFMKGKLKVTGNVMLAQKLGPLLKANSKL